MRQNVDLAVRHLVADERFQRFGVIENRAPPVIRKQKQVAVLAVAGVFEMTDDRRVDVLRIQAEIDDLAHDATGLDRILRARRVRQPDRRKLPQRAERAPDQFGLFRILRIRPAQPRAEQSRHQNQRPLDARLRLRTHRLRGNGKRRAQRHNEGCETKQGPNSDDGQIKAHLAVLLAPGFCALAQFGEFSRVRRASAQIVVIGYGFRRPSKIGRSMIVSAPAELRRENPWLWSFSYWVSAYSY